MPYHIKFYTAHELRPLFPGTSQNLSNIARRNGWRAPAETRGVWYALDVERTAEERGISLAGLPLMTGPEMEGER